jgi:hypothetical protein
MHVEFRDRRNAPEGAAQWAKDVDVLSRLDALLKQEPVAWMWQHGETGACGFLENAPREELERWERINKPRAIVAPLFATPPIIDQPPKGKP